jgi:hypothetical protein
MTTSTQDLLRANDTETAAVAATRSLDAKSFVRLLDAKCVEAIDDCAPADMRGVSIDPLVGSIQRRPHRDGVQFSMTGRLHAGTHRRFDVRLHGVQTSKGVDLHAVERAYDRRGTPGPRFVDAVA